MKEKTKKSWKMGKNMSIDDYLSATLKVKNGNDWKVIELKNISYISSSRCYCIFHHTDQSETLSGFPLPHYQKLLPRNFFGRFHRAYIINMAHVKDYTLGSNASVKMNQSVLLPLSSDWTDDFEQHYLQLKKKRCFFCKVKCHIYKRFKAFFAPCMKVEFRPF